MSEAVVKFKKFTENAVIPTRSNECAAGFDFYYVSDEEKPLMILPKGHAIVSSHIGWQPPSKEYYMQLQSRSGLSFKEGVDVSNAGVIDSDYRGEIKARLYNSSDYAVTINPGDRVFQGIIHKLPVIVAVEVDELDQTDRSDKGFGSSGK